MSLSSIVRDFFRRPYSTIRPTEAVAMMEERRAILIDVRTNPEWQAGHAPAARHVPLQQVAQRAGQLPAGRPVITTCRSGHRSARAAGLLAREGREVYNLSGGMAAWARAGFPVTGRKGIGRIM